MRISDRKLRIEFDRLAIRMFSLAVDDSSRLKRDSQTVPADRIFRIELHRPAGKLLRVGKSFRVVATGARLHQHNTQRDMGVSIKGRPSDRIAIRSFRIVPTLLIGVYVTQTIGCARIE